MDDFHPHARVLCEHPDPQGNTFTPTTECLAPLGRTNKSWVSHPESDDTVAEASPHRDRRRRCHRGPVVVQRFVPHDPRSVFKDVTQMPAIFQNGSPGSQLVHALGVIVEFQPYSILKSGQIWRVNVRFRDGPVDPSPSIARKLGQIVFTPL